MRDDQNFSCTNVRAIKVPTINYGNESQSQTESRIGHVESDCLSRETQIWILLNGKRVRDVSWINKYFGKKREREERHKTNLKTTTITKQQRKYKDTRERNMTQQVFVFV